MVGEKLWGMVVRSDRITRVHYGETQCSGRDQFLPFGWKSAFRRDCFVCPKWKDVVRSDQGLPPK